MGDQILVWNYEMDTLNITSIPQSDKLPLLVCKAP